MKKKYYQAIAQQYNNYNVSYFKLLLKQKIQFVIPQN